MTTHRMNLQPKYYDFIHNGTKRIELRLFDEKRQTISLGDEIVFWKSDNESFKVKVTGLLKYSSFEKLFNDFDIKILADQDMTKEELLNTLQEFYPKEKQESYGVLGIRFELL